MKFKNGILLVVLFVVLFGTAIKGFYKIREVREAKPIEISAEEIKREQNYYTSFIGQEAKDIMIDLEQTGFKQVEKQTYKNGYTFIKYNG